MRIRAARVDDFPVLRDIELAAGEIFRDIGMAEVAEYDPPADFRRSQAWVAADATDTPVAYLLAEPVDGALHIEQVSVHPDHAHQRIGRRLIDHLDAPVLTLTTFTDVPWNAPYYRRCGFVVLEEAGDAITPGLRAIREHEAAIGLDRWPRCCMRRDAA